MSEAEREFQEHKNLKLLNEKKALQSDIHKRVMQFDEALEQ